MSDTGAKYQAALTVEQEAWVHLRNHFYDEMRMAYENGGDYETRAEVCEAASKLVEAMACASSDVNTYQELLVQERRERQAKAAEEAKR